MKKKVVQESSKQVLKDYKKVGNTFVPPLLHRLGPWEYIGWQTHTMPEMVWWDVLADRVSPQFAAKVAEQIALYFKPNGNRQQWWAFISDYLELRPDDVHGLKNHLLSANLLNPFLEALGHFLDLYPECPLSKFYDQRSSGVVNSEYLSRFENRVSVLQDKRSREGVLAQAQAVYIAFVSGRLRVMQGLALADFPEVEHYPSTELSLKVGASICSVVNMLAGNSLPKYAEDKWVQYFWWRGLELRPLNFGYLAKG